MADYAASTAKAHPIASRVSHVRQCDDEARLVSREQRWQRGASTANRPAIRIDRGDDGDQRRERLLDATAHDARDGQRTAVALRPQ